MTQQERERKRILWLWHKVERLLFSPQGQKEQRRWCACFVRSLARYWEIDDFVVPGHSFPNASFNLPLLNFSFSYDLSKWGDNPRRSSVHMMFKGVVFACHDIDHNYDDRISLSDPPSDVPLSRHYPNISTRNDELIKDIRWVLDRSILHPCAHFHPVPDVLGYLGSEYAVFRDVLHEIRLGLGITNPFAALFQFRMNLLLCDTAHDTKICKEKERDRIADLVRDTILNNARIQTIPPSKLFDL